MTWPLHRDQARKCFWLMPSAIFLHGLTHRSNSISELMPYPSQPSQGNAWWKFQQKHNETQSCQQYTDWHWMVGPTDAQTSPELPENYRDFLDELSIKDDILMKGEWIIIPPSCRDAIMDDLHKSHAGINKALALARMCMKRYLMCIESSNLPIETLHPHEVPPGPWVKLGMDFFQDHHGKKNI